ncbi:MAG: hypothetical protein ACREAB_08980, partial [Blastocatellia bacterium]
MREDFARGEDGEELLVISLHLPGDEKFDIPDGLSVPRESIEEIADGGEFRFKTSPAGAVLSAHLTPDSATTTFFGKQINLELDLSAQITIRIPFTDQLTPLPFLTLDLCAAIKLDAEQGDTSVNFSTEPFCFRVTLERLPEFPSVELPAFHLKLPEIGLRLPHLRLPWQFPDFPNFPFHLPAFSLPHGALPLTVSWKAIRPSLGKDKVVIEIDRLKIEGKIGAIEADLRVVIKNGKVDTRESFIHFYRPGFNQRSRAPISHWHFDQECLALQWEDSELNAWLKLLAPDLAEILKIEG